MKAVVLVLADTETHEDRGRIRNALETAKEFKDAGDDIKLIFDGAGTKWIPEISKQDNNYLIPMRDQFSEARMTVVFIKQRNARILDPCSHTERRGAVLAG